MSFAPFSSRPPTRRREGTRPLFVAIGGIATLAVFLAVAYIATVAPKGGIPLVGYKTLHADVEDPGNLQQHDPIRIAGIRVGQVLGVNPEEGRSKVELQLDPGIDPLPEDTEVLVRGLGLLGARYIELRPGESSEDLPWGSTIEGGPEALTFGVPDALQTFDRETRGALAQMIDGFGRGLLDRGRDLNDAIEVTPQGARDFRALADEILARPGAARQLVPSLERAAAAFDGSREEIARMLAPTARGLQPFVDGREAVRDLLEEAPPSLEATQSGLEEGRRLVGAAHELSLAVSDALPAAPAGLRATTAMLRESPVPLKRAERLLRALGTVVPDTLRITDRLAPNLDPLRRLFDDLHRLAVPLVPHTCDVEMFAGNYRSVIGQADGPGGEIGPLGNFRAFAIALGPEAAGPFARLPEELERGHIYEPYPEPCKYSPGPTYDLTDIGLPLGGSE